MWENLKYFNRPRANLVDAEHEPAIPLNHMEAMRYPDIWLEPMTRELQVMREKEVH
jgi:hypothetical protein